MDQHSGTGGRGARRLTDRAKAAGDSPAGARVWDEFHAPSGAQHAASTRATTPANFTRLLGSNPIRVQDHVECRGRAHASKVVLFGEIPAGVPLPEELRRLTRCKPCIARGRGRLDQHAEVNEVCELRPRGICAVEQHDRFRGKVGRSPSQGIGAVAAWTSQEIEGIPTRGTTSPQWLYRFAFQPAPVYGICRSLFRRAAVPFRIAHVSSKEIIAWHDDRADGLSNRFGDGGLARTTPSINGHDQSLWADRAGTNRGDYGVDG